jgi:hypothetical protein
LSAVKIFIFASKNIINNLKVVESELTRNDNGLWIYEISNVELSDDDEIEYWIYVEHLKLGFYKNDNIKMRGKPI